MHTVVQLGKKVVQNLKIRYFRNVWKGMDAELHKGELGQG